MENIEKVSYSSIFAKNYIDYSMSVITSRALPDVRDGLKPVQRRIIHSMMELHNTFDKPHRKCARIVGDTMGKYHPHGDSSIYEALVNLSQDWKLPVKLVDGHGNFGSIDGSGAAAMRYTEARLTDFIEEAAGLRDYKKYYQEYFVPNFDNTESEPEILPWKIPNILTSGTMGIAVGLATSIPSFNLGEVCDATALYIKKGENISTEEILEVLPGPDFATGGIINANKEDILDIYKTGQGKLKVRGKIEVIPGERGRKVITITEFSPAMIGASVKFLDRVAELIRDKFIPSNLVVDIADRGDKDGEKLCIELKKGVTDDEINQVINVLLAKTDLESTFSCNFNVISNGKPVTMGIKQILKEFTEFSLANYTAKYQKLLENETKNLEIKEGLKEAVDVIDLIIEILRGSSNVKDAKACLMNGDVSNIKFRFEGSKIDAANLRFTEAQADAILSMRLQKLIGLEIKALLKDIDDLKKSISLYNKLLTNEKEMKKLMIKEIDDIKNKFSILRRSVIKKQEEIKEVKKNIQSDSEVYALLDRFYYIKVIDTSTFERNKESIVKDYRYSTKISSDGRIGIFANDGKMYMTKVSEIIKAQAKIKAKQKSQSIYAKMTDKGIQVFDFCGMSGKEDILLMCNIDEIKDKKLLFVEKTGLLKIVKGSEFDVSRKNITAHKETESIFGIIVVDEDKNFVCFKSKNGIYGRVAVEDIQQKSKTAASSSFIKLDKEDFIENIMMATTKDIFINVDVTKLKIVKRNQKGVKLRG